MPELIDKRKLLNALCKDCEVCKKVADAGGEPHQCWRYKLIVEQPTIEAEPVRHGRWAKSDVYIFKKCSECGAIWDAALCENIFFIYCPRCGSKNGGADNA